MNYKYIYPLYWDYEIDGAASYMAGMLTENFPVDLPSEVRTHVMEPIINSIKATYGVNAPMMANFDKVYREYLGRFRSHIMEYFKQFDIDVIEYRIDKSSVVFPASTRLNMSERNSLLCENFPADKKWECDKGYGKAELVNPMVGVQHIFLQLHNLTKEHEEFIKAMVEVYTGKNYIDVINKGSDVLDFFIHLLPSTNYASIFTLIRLAHQYL